MDNLMIARLEFRAEEDPEVAAHTFTKWLTTQVSHLNDVHALALFCRI